MLLNYTFNENILEKLVDEAGVESISNPSSKQITTSDCNFNKLVNCFVLLKDLAITSNELFTNLSKEVIQTTSTIDKLSSRIQILQTHYDNIEDYQTNSLPSNPKAVDENMVSIQRISDTHKHEPFVNRTQLPLTFQRKLTELIPNPSFDTLEPYKEYFKMPSRYNDAIGDRYSYPKFFLHEWFLTQEKRYKKREIERKQMKANRKKQKLSPKPSNRRLSKPGLQWRDRFTPEALEKAKDKPRKSRRQSLKESIEQKQQQQLMETYSLDAFSEEYDNLTKFPAIKLTEENLPSNEPSKKDSDRPVSVNDIDLVDSPLDDTPSVVDESQSPTVPSEITSEEPESKKIVLSVDEDNESDNESDLGTPQYTDEMIMDIIRKKFQSESLRLSEFFISSKPLITSNISSNVSNRSSIRLSTSSLDARYSMVYNEKLVSERINPEHLEQLKSSLDEEEANAKKNYVGINLENEHEKKLEDRKSMSKGSLSPVPVPIPTYILEKTQPEPPKQPPSQTSSERSMPSSPPVKTASPPPPPPPPPRTSFSSPPPPELPSTSAVSSPSTSNKPVPPPPPRSMLSNPASNRESKRLVTKSVRLNKLFAEIIAEDEAAETREKPKPPAPPAPPAPLLAPKAPPTPATPTNTPANTTTNTPSMSSTSTPSSMPRPAAGGVSLLDAIRRGSTLKPVTKDADAPQEKKSLGIFSTFIKFLFAFLQIN